MKIDVQALLESLPYMGKGMMGIFIVTLTIILTVTILNSVTNKKK